MLENNFMRVYDCGQVSYVWRNDLHINKVIVYNPVLDKSVEIDISESNLIGKSKVEYPHE